MHGETAEILIVLTALSSIQDIDFFISSRNLFQ